MLIVVIILEGVILMVCLDSDGVFSALRWFGGVLFRGIGIYLSSIWVVIWYEVF